MNEYVLLINYLKENIESINNKRKENEEKNVRQSFVKNVLLSIIELIENHRIDQIDINELKKLEEYLIDTEIESIGNRLLELSAFQLFLYDDSVNNPIKTRILDDLNKIKNRLISINDSIVELTLTDDELRKEKRYQDYLNFISDEGYSRVLLEHERKEFYDFLKQSSLDRDVIMKLILDYIKYARKKVVVEEKVSEKIDVVEENAEKTLKRLTKYKEGVEKIKISTDNLDNEKEKELVKEMEEMLEVHKNVDEGFLEILDGYNIEQICEYVGIFKNADGSMDDASVVTFIRKALPELGTKYKELIMQKFKEIAELSKEKLSEAEKKDKNLKLYKRRLNKTKREFDVEYIKVLDEYRLIEPEMQKAVAIIVNKISESLSGNTDAINSILQSIEEIEEVDDKKAQSFAAYGISEDEILLYDNYKRIQSNIDFIEKSFNLQDFSDKELSELTEEDIDEYCDIEKVEASEALNNIKVIIDDCKVTLDELGNDGSTVTPGMQYENGNSIIVFARRDDNPKSLFEEDMDTEHTYHEPKSINDIRNILLKTSKTSDWEELQKKDRSHFKSEVVEAKANGEMGSAYTMTSNQSGKTYTLYRLKGSGATFPRVIMFDIDMCKENREKVGIPDDKHIILIVGEKEVHRHNEKEKVEYSTVKRRVNNNEDLIQHYFKLFEDPKTSTKELIDKLEDSSKLYDTFVETEKGMGEY